MRSLREIGVAKLLERRRRRAMYPPIRVLFARAANSVLTPQTSSSDGSTSGIATAARKSPTVVQESAKTDAADGDGKDPGDAIPSESDLATGKAADEAANLWPPTDSGTSTDAAAKNQDTTTTETITLPSAPLADLLNSAVFLQRQDLYKWLRGKSMDPMLQFTPEDPELEAEAVREMKEEQEAAREAREALELGEQREEAEDGPAPHNLSRVASQEQLDCGLIGKAERKSWIDELVDT